MMMRNTYSLLVSACLFLPFFCQAQKIKPSVSIGHKERAIAIDFSPNGQFVVSGGENGKGYVKVWEARTGHLLKTWNPSKSKNFTEGKVFDVQFYDNEHIFVCAKGMPLQLWNFTNAPVADFSSETTTDAAVSEEITGTEILTSTEEIKIYGSESDQGEVRAVSINPQNSKEVLALYKSGDLILWNVRTSKSRKLDGAGAKVLSICYAPDGKTIYGGTDKGDVLTWESKTGKSGKKVKKHNGAVWSLEVSSGGDMMLSGGQQSLKLWELTSEKELKVFSDAYIPSQTACFSPDDRFVVYGATRMRPLVVVWDIKAEKDSLELLDPVKKSINANVMSVDFSKDGSQILSGYFHGGLLSWDATDGTLKHRMEGQPRQIMDIGFSQDEKSAFITYKGDAKITVWHIYQGEEEELNGHTDFISAAAMAPSGDFILSADEDNFLLKWDLKRDSIIWKSSSLSNQITAIAISPDERYAMTASKGQKQVDVWNLAEMKKERSFPHHFKEVTSLAFSSDGSLAMTSANDRSVNVYQVNKNWKKQYIPNQTQRFNPVAFSPDGRYFLSVACNDLLIELWDVSGGRLMKTFKMKDYQGIAQPPFICGPSKPAFSEDGEQFLVPTLNGATLWKTAGGDPISLRGHEGAVESVAFVNKGQVAVTASKDGAVKFWNTNNGDLLATVYQLPDNNWAAITPNGLFDTSPDAMHLMYFVQGLETIELEQLKSIYYEPELMAILLNLENKNLKNVSLNQLDLYPEAYVEIKNNKLLIDLTVREGGVGKVDFHINGTMVVEDVCKGTKNCPSIDLEQFKNHYYSGEKEKGDNVIAVYTHNKEGWLKSPPYEVYPFPKTGKGGPGGLANISFAERPEPGLHAIVIGTSDYSGESIDLSFSDDDATAIATSLENIGKELFGAQVDVKKLTSTDADLSKRPTRTNIKKAFNDVAAKATAEDVFILFLSGHGVAYTENKVSDFYYLTQDCGDMDLSISKTRTDFCVSTNDMTAWMQELPAKKRVIILDACYSGEAANSFSTGKSVTTTQEKELERLKDRNGMYVLASSESGQQSFENKNLRQGLLTFSLLEEISRTPKEVDVSELFNNAKDKVEDLAAGIDEVQSPVLTVPSKDAGSFSIGIMRDDTEIPLRKKSNFIAPFLFLDKEKLDDHLFLSNLMDEYVTRDNPDGKLGRMIFVNNPKKKEAYTIRGLYRTSSTGSVMLDGKIFRSGKEVATFQVNGKVGDTKAVWRKALERSINNAL